MSVGSSNKFLSKCIIVYCKVALLYTELRLRLLWSQRRSSSSSESISLNVVVSVVRVISQNTAAAARLQPATLTAAAPKARLRRLVHSGSLLVLKGPASFLVRR